MIRCIREYEALERSCLGSPHQLQHFTAATEYKFDVLGPDVEDPRDVYGDGHRAARHIDILVGKI
jgi:hypothetical protein